MGKECNNFQRFCIAVKTVTYDIGDAVLADLKFRGYRGGFLPQIRCKTNFDVKAVPQRKEINVTATLDTEILM